MNNFVLLVIVNYGTKEIEGTTYKFILNLNVKFI